MINTKRILMNTKALRSNLEILMEKIIPDLRTLSVQVTYTSMQKFKLIFSVARKVGQKLAKCKQK